jgi:hypothetical protein
VGEDFLDRLVLSISPPKLRLHLCSRIEPKMKLYAGRHALDPHHLSSERAEGEQVSDMYLKIRHLPLFGPARAWLLVH